MLFIKIGYKKNSVSEGQSETEFRAVYKSLTAKIWRIFVLYLNYILPHKFRKINIYDKTVTISLYFVIICNFFVTVL